MHDLQPHPLAALVTALLDQIDAAVLACTTEGQVLFANAAARAEIAAGHWLRQAGGARLAAAGLDGHSLRASLVAASMRGRRQLLQLVDGDERRTAIVAPLPAALAGIAAGGLPVLMMLGRREPCSTLGLEMLAARHGLSDAERRVMVRLVAREAPAAIAEAHGVAISTVRTQVKALYLKLGVHSVEALVAMAAGVPPLASALLSGFTADAGEATAPGWWHAPAGVPLAPASNTAAISLHA
jgi:DNA-binding CsgD family transcriptional regulator